jgi:hypothetical protein
MMINPSSGEPVDKVTPREVTPGPTRHRRKRHRLQRQKRLDRIRKRALTAFLYVLAIGLTLAIWYELLKGPL